MHGQTRNKLKMKWNPSNETLKFTTNNLDQHHFDNIKSNYVVNFITATITAAIHFIYLCDISFSPSVRLLSFFILWFIWSEFVNKSERHFALFTHWTESLFWSLDFAINKMSQWKLSVLFLHFWETNLSILSIPSIFMVDLTSKESTLFWTLFALSNKQHFLRLIHAKWIKTKLFALYILFERIFVVVCLMEMKTIFSVQSLHIAEKKDPKENKKNR